MQAERAEDENPTSEKNAESTLPKAESADDNARNAGRGGLAIAGAKVSFILFGFVQQLFLPRLLGTKGYGDVSLVLAIVGVVNNVVVTSSIQGVSRAVSGAPAGGAAAAMRNALRTHAILAVVVASIFGALAGTIADLEGAPSLTTPLRVVALVVLLYGLYAPLVGALNGSRRFLAQAGLDIGYQVLRTIGLLGGAYMMIRSGASGVVGALGGFVAAAALILPVALNRLGLKSLAAPAAEAGIKADFDATAYLRSLIPLALGQAFLNLLMQTDFLLLGRFLHTAGTEDEAAMFVGVQRGVQLFGFLPSQFLMSVSFVLFPMLAKAQAEGNKEDVRRFTQSGVRLAVILTGLNAAPIVALAPSLLKLAFAKQPEIALYGAAPLRIYAIGMAAFSVLGIGSSVLVSLGRARSAATITALAATLVAVLSIALVPAATLGEPMLVRSAIATSIALVLAVSVAGLLIKRTAGGFVSPLTLVRTGLAMAASIATGMALPARGPVFVVLYGIALYAVYFAVLLVTRELGEADLAFVKGVLGKKKK